MDYGYIWKRHALNKSFLITIILSRYDRVVAAYRFHDLAFLLLL